MSCSRSQDPEVLKLGFQLRREIHGCHCNSSSDSKMFLFSFFYATSLFFYVFSLFIGLAWHLPLSISLWIKLSKSVFIVSTARWCEISPLSWAWCLLFSGPLSLGFWLLHLKLWESEKHSLKHKYQMGRIIKKVSYRKLVTIPVPVSAHAHARAHTHTHTLSQPVPAISLLVLPLW